MKKQYMVQEGDINKREEFFDYIVNNYKLNIEYPYEKRLFSKSKFPFVIDFEDNTFWICESIICCAQAAQNKKIISIEEFKEVYYEII